LACGGFESALKIMHSIYALSGKSVQKPEIPPITSLLHISFTIKVVDVGAKQVGDEKAPYRPLLSAGLAQLIGFEPNADALAQLNEIKGPQDTYLPYAVGDGQRHTMHHCRSASMSSLLPPNKPVLELFHNFSYWGEVVHEEEVDTVRLDDVAETAGMEFLKID